MKRWSGLLIGAGVVVAVAIIAILAHDHGKKSASSNMGNMNMSSNSSSSSSSSGSTSNSTPAVATSAVTIKDYAFGPQNITVKVGTKVTWTNNDSVSHTVTADTSSANAPTSSEIAPGQKYSFTFLAAGTYTYHCTIHPSMQAKVTVTN